MEALERLLDARECAFVTYVVRRGFIKATVALQEAARSGCTALCGDSQTFQTWGVLGYPAKSERDVTGSSMPFIRVFLVARFLFF